MEAMRDESAVPYSLGVLSGFAVYGDVYTNSSAFLVHPMTFAKQDFLTLIDQCQYYHDEN